MKSILFIIPDWYHGGTNKSLENLLSLIGDNYKINILSLQKEGIYKKTLSPYNIIILPFIFKLLIYNVLCQKIISFICNHLRMNIINDYIYKSLSIYLESKYKFDKVIAYQEGKSTLLASFFSVSKIAWVHCDYELYKKSTIVNIERELSIYKRFKDIICVSNYTTQTFKNNFPTLSSSIHSIGNTMNENKIRQEANHTIKEYNRDRDFIIVSVGRFVKVKQFHLIPQIVNSIRELNETLNFRWYIIGDGDENYIKKTLEEVSKYQVNTYVELLGSKRNPYPYIKNAHILVCISESEACPYVINEAKILHTPIVSTNFPSAVEIINDKIGQTNSIELIAETISNIMNNCNNIYTELKKNIDGFNYDNSFIINQIKSILEK